MRKIKQKWEHLSRNIYNLCPKKEPKQCEDGKYIDSNGNTWKEDNPIGEWLFHNSYNCYRHNHSQCCYDKNGNLVNTGHYQGTYDYYEPNGIIGKWKHWKSDVWPHIWYNMWGDENYYDWTKIY